MNSSAVLVVENPSRTPWKYTCRSAPVLREACGGDDRAVLPETWRLVDLIEQSWSGNRSVRARIVRAADVAASLLLLITLAPILLVVTVLVKLTSTGPVIEWHSRRGPFARRYSVLTFRTVTLAFDSGAQLDEAGPPSDVIHIPGCYLRTTPVGRILRRYGIDKLPMLINVLRGDISLAERRPIPDRTLRQVSSGRPDLRAENRPHRETRCAA